MEPLPSASGLRYLLPELGLIAVAAISMFVHLFGRRRGHRWAGYTALTGLALVAVVLTLSPQSPGPLYSGHLVIDSFSLFFKLVFLIAAGLAVGLSFRFFDVEGSEPGEIYYLLPLTVIGMMVAVSSVDLVSTYVSFELFAIPSYILAGIFKKDRRSAEAGIKYFFLGTLSSGLMLLGMALVFGLTGETNYGAILRSLGGADLHIALTGMILFFAGLFFKSAMVPFHMWAPDVYEGAPTPLVVFLSTAPKAAVFAILIRLLAGFFGRFEAQWTPVLQAVSLLTMFWGNIAALIQENVKRLMAYSSIAHAGYLAIGLAAFGETGRLAVLYYIFVYVFMNAAAFGLVLLLRKGAGFGEDVSDLRGLARRSPLAAGCILVLLLSLTGIPPTAGFMGKYFLFAAAVEKGMVFLAVAGALNSVISLFYYFRLGRAMFMEEETGAVRVEPSAPVLAVIGGSALVLLILGILPFLLTSFASAARPAGG
jgi:NADH-quinone oxidoreductase subunit N